MMMNDDDEDSDDHNHDGDDGCDHDHDDFTFHNPPFYQLIVTAMDKDYQEEKGDDIDGYRHLPNWISGIPNFCRILWPSTPCAF